MCVNCKSESKKLVFQDIINSHPSLIAVDLFQKNRAPSETALSKGIVP
jgi:hypothetical protein